MPDRVTANLPSRNLDRTAAFYRALGFGPYAASAIGLIRFSSPPSASFASSTS